MTDELKKQARAILTKWKGESYVFGLECAPQLGALVRPLGSRAVLITSGLGQAWGSAVHDVVVRSLAAAAVEVIGAPIRGAAPNSPVEDVARLAGEINARKPQVVVSVGGGSGIDAVKGALAVHALGDLAPLESCFGVGQVSQKLQAAGRKLLPLVAMQLASGSAAHLTKYSNITNLKLGQKLLIIDEAIVPPRALFDYAMTVSMSASFTMDGGLDGVSHSLEVFEGIAADKEAIARPVCLLGIELIVHNLKSAIRDPANLAAREALGLGTDLGGYAIMIGGTNGAHLNSFSLVDLLPHGRACALMNPYYTVLFAPAIEARLRAVGDIYHAAGYITMDLRPLHGRSLGLAVAEGMMNLSRDIGFPTRLRDVPGFTPAHIARCLTAAKNPALESKLKNMPVPLSADLVDAYIGPVLEAAQDGDLEKVRNM